MVSITKNSCSMHEKFDTMFMGLFLLLVPQGQVPPDSCENFLHLHKKRDSLERGPHQNSDTVTFCELDKISKDRNKSLSSSEE